METLASNTLPVAVIGGGPVGLAAAANLVSRGLPVKVYEAGPEVGWNLRDWGHVRVFTPWRYCIDQSSAMLLKRQGWRMPEPDGYPTGIELVRSYLEPLARTPELATAIETGASGSQKSRGMAQIKLQVVDERGAPSFSRLLRPKAIAAIWLVPSLTPREHGRRQTRSGPAACQRWARMSSATGLRTESRMFFPAIVLSMRVEARS